MRVKKSFIFSLFLFLICSTIFAGELETGKSYHGFKLIEKRFVKEVNADCYFFKHEKSGAQLLKIAAEDINKTFGIAFKTVPESDCGTPHIMEHSVLNGSKKYPVKSPFDILVKGSLNTFINAFTGSDRTFYPFASMNEKDYFNLMDIYLDAVLNPLIYDDPRILKQEGWHHELENEDGDVLYKGVVYNEMKGAFSTPTRELYYQAYKHLFPDNGYQYSSGGYPQAIPELTNEQFLNFHKKYYHPSNSHIFLYGDADLDKELELIDKEFLSKFNDTHVKAEFPIQKPFDKMKEYHGFYPVTEGADTKEQTYLALNIVAGLNTDPALVMALDILTDALVNQESAPVRLALQEAGIGKEVTAGYDDIKQNVFEIRVQNANPDQKEKFYEIVTSVMKKVAEEGLDKEALEGIINRMEFHLREGDDAQKGLTNLFNVMRGWFFNNDPFIGLEYEKPLAKIKESLENGYLESVIKEYLIDNPHSILMVLEPKPGMENEIVEKTSKELAEYKKSLSKDDLTNLVKETKELIEYQKREDTPEALASIPLLELSDINPKAEWYSIENKKLADKDILYHKDFTNGVVYGRQFFDTRVLPEELIPYAALLTEVLGSQNTENYSYGDLDKQLNIHTGGFSAYLNTYVIEKKDENFIPYFVVNAKAMNNKLDKMFELLEEIVNKTKYDDKERLKAILTRFQARMEGAVKGNGYRFASMRALSYFSEEGLFNEITGGIEYYRFLTDLVKNYDANADKIVENLEKTAKLLFNKNNLSGTLTCDEIDVEKYEKEFAGFVSSLPGADVKMNEWKLKPENKKEGILTASKVQYVIQGYDYKKLGYEWNGKIQVLNQVVSREWLQNQVRVIGGAYGGWITCSPNGQVSFNSYRDPNLKETLVNYDNTVEYLKNFDAEKTEMTRFIIGTIANIDNPLTPSQKGNVAVRRYLEKTTKEDIQEERDAILSTTKEDIRSFAKMIGDVLAKDNYCVYGNEEKVNSEKELFTTLSKLDKE